MTGTAKAGSEEIRVIIETDPHGEIDTCDTVPGALTIQGQVFDIVEVCSRGDSTTIEAEGDDGKATIDGAINQHDDGTLSLKGQLTVKKKNYRLNVNER
jgi:hypothetical protein